MKRLLALLLAATPAAAGTIAPTTQVVGVVWDSNTTVGAATIPLMLPPWSAGQVVSCSYYVTGGSFTASLQIGGVAVTGCGAISVSSSTPATATATALNTFTSASSLSLVISGVSGTPTTALFQINIQTTAN